MRSVGQLAGVSESANPAQYMGVPSAMHSHTHDLTLGLAFFLGALHALEPGHGKTAMLIYLADGKRNFWHPLVMGLSSAVAHSVSLVAIALAVHLTHHVVTGDHHHDDAGVTVGLQWVSAALVVCVGLWMLRSAMLAKPTKCGCQHHRHECNQPATVEAQPRKPSYTMSAVLGVAFGLLPCPSAMAAYFSSMSTGTPVAAYAVIGLFAAGIASSLTLVGIFVQRFGGKMLNKETRLSRLPWPYLRAGLILSIGLLYVARLVIV